LGLDVCDPKIIAQNGWTTSDLIDGINNESISEKFDLVTLCIGVNNQYQGLDLEEYRTELKFLLLKAIEFAGNNTDNVIVLSIPNWGETPFANDRNREEIAESIREFNRVKSELCDNYEVLFVNITEHTLNVVDKPELLATDSLHYSGKMHQIWVNEVVKYIKSDNEKFTGQSY
jgi:lysophospholipase L1-like esterase